MFASLFFNQLSRRNHLKNPWNVKMVAFAVLALVLGSVTAFAEDRKLGWAETGELSFVQTSGNTSTSTLGFKNTLVYLWERRGLTFNAGAVRASTKALDVAATGSASDFSTSDGDRETTAEIYYFNTRYDQKITDRFLWYVGAGWDRNKGAGVKNRYVGEAGLANVWVDTPTFKFQTGYAATFTKEKDYIDNPDFDDSFAGVRLSYDLMKKLGEPTTFTSKLVVDDNISETQDYRADMTNSIAVSMNKHLALKVSLEWLYDHRPALKEIPLNGGPATVLVELDDLDSILTASVVATF